MKSVCKPVKPRDFLRRDAHQSFELRTQVVLADADLLAQRPNGQCTVMMVDLCHGILHDVHVARDFTKPGKQYLFQQGKPCLDRGCHLQLFAEFGGVTSPDGIQWDDLTIYFRKGKLQEWIGSSWPEMDAEKPDIRRPIDAVIGAPDPHPPAMRAGHKGFRLSGSIHVKRRAQVDH